MDGERGSEGVIYMKRDGWDMDGTRDVIEGEGAK